MVTAFEDQIAALEREKARLEALLSSDESWLTLQALVGADPEAKAVLKKALAANPYFVAREKIVEAISILGHTNRPASKPARRPNLAELIGSTNTYDGEVPASGGDAPGTQSGTAHPHRFESELTLVRGIDEALAIQLAGLGITRCSEVAAWTAADVERVKAALDLGKRISRENWIEQAALRSAVLPKPPPLAVPAVAPSCGLEPPQSIETKSGSPDGPAKGDNPAESLRAFTRPPLFDVKPERILPPFVARTIVPEAPVSHSNPLAHEPAPFAARRSSAEHDIDTLEYALAEAASAAGDSDLAEADVVIISPRKVQAEASPPPLPQASVDASTAPPAPMRRHFGSKRSRDVDTTPYADTRGVAEEAAVEIIRPKGH